MQLTEYAHPSLFAEVYLFQESYARSKGFTEIDIPRALERAWAGQFARYLRTVVINSPQFSLSILNVSLKPGLLITR